MSYAVFAPFIQYYNTFVGWYDPPFFCAMSFLLPVYPPPVQPGRVLDHFLFFLLSRLFLYSSCVKGLKNSLPPSAGVG